MAVRGVGFGNDAELADTGKKTRCRPTTGRGDGGPTARLRTVSR